MDNTSAVLNEILSELKTLKSDFKLMEAKQESIEEKLIQIQSTRNTPMVNDNARITPIRLALDGSGSIVMSSDTSIKAPNPRRMSSSTGEFVAQQIELQEESATKSTSSSNLVPLTTTKKPSAFDKAEKSGESVIDTYLNMMKSEVAKVRVQDDKGSDISASIARLQYTRESEGCHASGITFYKEAKVLQCSQCNQHYKCYFRLSSSMRSDRSFTRCH